MEWKAGMKIRCIEKYGCFNVGDVFELKELHYGNMWDTNPSASLFICRAYEDNWEVVDMFTKDDLEVGMLVVDRVGCKYMVMPTTNGLIVIDENDEYIIINTLNEDLTSRFDKDCDIVKVYGLEKYETNVMSFHTQCRELLWERKEIKEVTMEELEKQYGCKVKIVKD